MKKLINVLKELREKNNMFKFVIDDLMETPEEELEQHMKEVVNYGCVNGTVTSLIYYKDTVDFFDTYKEEIIELLKEKDVKPSDLLKFDSEDPFCEEPYNKNLLAWFAYEEITLQGLVYAGIY